MTSRTTVSIVSHGQLSILKALLDDFENLNIKLSKVIITLNLKNEPLISFENYKFKIELIKNKYPKGFAENHNFAFRKCESEFFCVLNPDIRIEDNLLFERLEKSFFDKNFGISAPLIVDSNNSIEDSARYFPSLKTLFVKFFFNDKGKVNIEDVESEIYPDWIAGMFLFFKSENFLKLNGFDENFFMYYEDVDISARAWQMGLKVQLNTQLRAIHLAQRKSHTNIYHFFLHLKSLLRYLVKYKFSSPKKI